MAAVGEVQAGRQPTPIHATGPAPHPPSLLGRIAWHMAGTSGLAIVAAAALEPAWTEAAGGIPTMAFIITGIALLFAVNIAIVRHALAPLRDASRAAALIDPARPGLRIPEGGLPREIVPLIQSVNAAWARLERGFEAQREFTSDAAHELKTPLAVLRAHLDTLAERVPVAALRQDVDAMSRLVDQLLRIAQVETLVVGPEANADLHAIAVNVAAHLAPLALRDGKSIAVTGSDAPVRVNGDADSLTQAVRNLVENALAHTPRETTIEVEVDEAGTVRISDFGPGIPPAHRELIFHRFWRANRSGSGSGLGLAIVRRIADAHGGKIELVDMPGRGACFVLRVPKFRDPSARASNGPDLTQS